jgi:periplasmic protein TonB
MEPQKVLSTDLLDIIFEGRNKQYGAYYLRRIYEEHVLRALLVGGSLILLGFAAPFIYKGITSALTPAQQKTEVSMTDIELPVDAPPPPPPPPPPNEPPPPPKNTIQYVPPKVEEDKKVVEETPPPANDKIEEEIATKKMEGTGDVKIPEAPEVGEGPKEEPKAAPVEDNSVTENAAVEQPAEFPGGTTELMKWLSSNVKYPAIARENNIQGRVVVKFIVEKDGSVSNVTVLKKVHELLDAEAVRLTKAMPTWKSGKQGGKSVRCYFTLPVSFKLEG